MTCIMEEDYEILNETIQKYKPISCTDVDKLMNSSMYYRYGIGGLCSFRGCMNPDQIHTLVVKGANRGRFCIEIPQRKKADYFYAFDCNNKLVAVRELASVSKDTELITYPEPLVQLGIVLQSYPWNHEVYEISGASICRYDEAGYLKSMSYGNCVRGNVPITHMEHSRNTPFEEDNMLLYESIQRINEGANLVNIIHRYLFSLVDGMLDSYRYGHYTDLFRLTEKTQWNDEEIKLKAPYRLKPALGNGVPTR